MSNITLPADTINYLFITDLHIDSDSDLERSTYLLNQAVSNANKKKSIDFICIGGDLTTRFFYNKQDWKDWIDAVLKPLKQAKVPIFILNGNHDDNSNILEEDVDNLYTISSSFYYETVISEYVNVNIVHDSNNTLSKYYYYDISKGSDTFRIVCLDSNDKPDYSSNKQYWGFSKEQVDWVNSEVFTEDHYKYVFLSHMSIDKSCNSDHKTIYYADEMLGIIKEKIEDHDILINSFGHIHLRLLTKNSFGLPYSCSPSLLSGGMYDRVRGEFLCDELNDKRVGWELLHRGVDGYSFDLLAVGSNYVKRYSVGVGEDKELIWKYC